jgi:hypothetical protein
VIHRRRARAPRGSLAAGITLLWLILSALACTSGARGGGAPEAGTGAGGSASAAPDPSTTGGNAAAPAEAAGSTVANGPTDGGVGTTDGGFDAAPPAPADAGPRDANSQVGQQPGCPAELPEFYAVCPREGLTCEYGMECCPDLAFCEFGQWTLLTHHCDACI